MLVVMACTACSRARAGPRLVEHDQQHAQAERNFGSQECRRRDAIGERWPGKMKQRQRQSEQPCRGLPAATASAQQSDRCRQQNDPVADFDGHAQGQGIGPQQDAGAGEAYQNGRDHRQGKNQIAAAGVEQNRARQQSHGEHECRLHGDQIEGRGNFRARSSARPGAKPTKAAQPRIQTLR